MRWAKLYAGSLDPTAPEISPVRADLTGLPPTLVVNGDAELLADDARSFVERAQRAGVQITHHVERDMIHAFMALGRSDAATERAFARIAEFAAQQCPVHEIGWLGRKPDARAAEPTSLTSRNPIDHG